MKTPQQENQPSPNDAKAKKSKLPLWIVLGALVIGGVVIFYYSFFIARFVVSTSDAYVEGNILEVYPRAQGTLKIIAVDETNCVQAGQILAVIDDVDYKLMFDESKAKLALALRNTQQMFDQVDELYAAIDQQLVYLQQAQMHFNHRKDLVNIGGVSKENFEDAQAHFLASQKKLACLEEELKRAQAQTYNATILTHPQVVSAMENVRQRWLQLQNTVIRAPCAGFVAKKNAQLGENVSLKQPVLAIVPLNNLWVSANLKEVQLKHIRIGQSVLIKTDMYKKSHIFEGKILGIGAGTGSVFSILPPQNATGNWIKIVQRVPVRIGLRAEEIQQFPLRLGLSCEVKIDVKQQGGAVLAESCPQSSIYQTNIYDHQLEGVDLIIQKVIQENLKGCNEH